MHIFTTFPISPLQEAIRNHEVINILQAGGEAASAGL
jgi:hypothetical protein